MWVAQPTGMPGRPTAWSPDGGMRTAADSERRREEERYVAVVCDFKSAEPAFRRGFEAALHQGMRGKTYSDVEEQLCEDYPEAYADDAFRRGFERGRMYVWVFKDPPGQ